MKNLNWNITAMFGMIFSLLLAAAPVTGQMTPSTFAQLNSPRGVVTLPDRNILIEIGGKTLTVTQAQ
jgi:hypothetical protein